MISLLAALFVLAPQVDVQFRPIANLTYELDLLTGQMPREAIQNVSQLWNERFLKSSDDRALVELWKRRRSEIAQTPEPGVASKVFFPIEFFGSYADRVTRVRGAGFDATSLGDYAQRIKKELTPDQAADLEKVVTAFLPRFTDWWNAEAVPSGAPYAERLRQLMASEGIQRSLAQFEKFYRPQLPKDARMPIVLLLRPGTIKEPTSGQQLGSYSVVQFLQGEKPEDRIDVVLHEFDHFLYGSASATDLAALQQRFLDLNRPEAVPAYNLLNEALATAFGNGIISEQVAGPEKFAQRLAHPLSLYNDPAIDGAAKAILPWLKSYLSKGGSLYDAEFVPQYVESLEKGIPDILSKPRTSLGRIVAISDNSIAGLSSGPMVQALRCSSFSHYRNAMTDPDDFSALKNNPNTSVLITVSPNRRIALKGVLSASEWQAFQTQEKGIFAFRRNVNAIGYVVVASTADEAAGAINKIAGLTAFSPGWVSGS